MSVGKRILFSIYGAFLFFLALNLCIGEYGIFEKHRLAGYRDMLIHNINELGQIETKLQGHSVSLRTDPDRVALLARELGYMKENELLVRIDGFEKKQDHYAVGRTLTRTGTSGTKKTVLRSASFISALLIFFVLSLQWKGRNDKKHL